MNGVLAKLYREGSLVHYEDYASRSAIDWSPFGNNGILSGTKWIGRGAVSFRNSSSSVITVPDAPEIGLTTGCLIAFGDLCDGITVGDILFSKADASSTNYELRLDKNPRIEFADGATTVVKSGSLIGKKYLGVNFSAGDTPEAFVDGSSIGNFSGVVNPVANTADLKIGNVYTGGLPLQCNLVRPIIVNRELTAQEHTDLFEELQNIIWPTMPYTRVQPNPGGSAALWKTDFGVEESVVPVTSGYLENSPFRVTSGSHKVSTQIADSRNVKRVETVSSGTYHVPTVNFHQTENEAAYGTWDFQVDRSASNYLRIGIISNVVNSPVDGSFDGYSFDINTSGSVRLVRRDSGVSNIIIPGGVFSSGIVHARITRSPAGLFELIVNDQSQGTVVDNTHTSSKFMVFDADNGDVTLYADKAGGHAISKRI